MAGPAPDNPADNPDLKHVKLTPADADGGFALSSRVGWNQALSDWTYMLAMGEGVGLISASGALVATAIALPYDRFAWICMVLVDPDFRRRGLATRLMDEVVSGQVAAGRVPGLDATPDGREVYRRIGFRDHYQLGRYRADTPDAASMPGPLEAGVTIRPLSAGALGSLAEMDRRVFGADRSGLLSHLLSRVPGASHGAWRGDDLAGYVFVRDGREAHQLGPLVATDAAVAVCLAKSALEVTEGPVYLDVPNAQSEFVSWLNVSGFALQRPYIRMYQGRSTGFDDPGSLFAIAGPELG